MKQDNNDKQKLHFKNFQNGQNVNQNYKKCKYTNRAFC